MLGILIAYALVALIFLLLASGWYRPKSWRELNERTVMILRFGCLFGLVVIVLRLTRLLF